MANTLTDLIPTIYAAMDVVSRELVGFIPAAAMDASAERAAKDQTIRTHVAPAAAAEDYTPGTTPPDTGDQTIGNVSLSIDKIRDVPIRWTGEEELSLAGSGPGVENIRRDQVAQALRTLVNEMEGDLADAAYQGASRAAGTAGTTPFASSLEDAAEVLQILEDNGAPGSDLNLVVNTTTATKIRSLAQLSKANEAGGDDLLRRGVLLDLFGMDVRKSAGLSTHTKGTGTSYLVDSADPDPLPLGTTSIPVDTGSGTIVAGDIVTFAADTTNKYVVTGALSGGSFTIGEPGLQATIPNNNAVTIGADHLPNVAFHRNSLVLLARLPAQPSGGDMASDTMTVTDPVSGMSFEFAVYPQYGRVRYEVRAAWGVKNVKADHSALLLG